MRLFDLPEAHSLSVLTRDGRLLFVSRITRLFAYGLISVVLVLYLAQVGFDEGQIGLLLSLTLAGDTVVSLWITTRADHMGRRKMLLLGAGLMILAGTAFSASSSFIILTLAAIIGVISPSGNEIGPFLAIEQAGLAHTIPDNQRTQIFAWYNLAGSVATACGALIGGGAAALLQAAGNTPLTSYRFILLLYALLGAVLLVIFTRLSSRIELAAAPAKRAGLGIERSRSIVLRLSALFALDAFGGALIVQSLVAYWFHVRFGVDTAVIGAIFFGANIFAGLSALAAARIATRIGLINTMVFTHIPSNILLMLVPLMPTLPLAVFVLLVRFSISQMDVPTRQSYVMAVVDPTERSAAAGVTGIARTVGAACAPLLSGLMLGAGLLSLPFFAAGGLKIAYDLALYRSFRRLKPPEEVSG
ncbi:MAG: MFS transporter [Anaerolineae bacterium]|nr:MFS transporter [Anaerolineae bacterium]